MADTIDIETRPGKSSHYEKIKRIALESDWDSQLSFDIKVPVSLLVPSLLNPNLLDGAEKEFNTLGEFMDAWKEIDILEHTKFADLYDNWVDSISTEELREIEITGLSPW